MMISLSVATGENFEIGQKGSLPWHIPSELKNFKALTLGHPLIMGRKTFDSIGRPLPGRQTIVVSRQNNLPCVQKWPMQCYHACDIEQAIVLARQNLKAKEVFVCGGAEIYEQALQLEGENAVGKIYWTQIHETFKEADRHFFLLEKLKNFNQPLLIKQFPQIETKPAWTLWTLMKA